MGFDDLSDETVERVLLYKQAKEVYDLAVTVSSHPYFFESLCKLFSSHTSSSPGPEDVEDGDAMSQAEAIRFERRLVPFGIYQGQRVGDVPISYWINITEHEFPRQLRRYLASRYFQSRQDKEIE